VPTAASVIEPRPPVGSPARSPPCVRRSRKHRRPAGRSSAPKPRASSGRCPPRVLLVPPSAILVGYMAAASASATRSIGTIWVAIGAALVAAAPAGHADRPPAPAAKPGPGAAADDLHWVSIDRASLRVTCGEVQGN